MLKSSLIFGSALFAGQSINNSDCDAADTVKRAICILEAQAGQKATGVVKFEQENNFAPPKISASFTGLAKNHAHGFHIHQWGDLTKGCITAGPHFNPHSKTHGGPFSETRHVGDLGNVFSKIDGTATYEHTDHLVSLSGTNSVVGRACVLHSFTDDLGKGSMAESKKTGSAGPRIACGIIGLSQ